MEDLRLAIKKTLSEASAEERFLLSAYYLDQHTLHEISRVLRVHEATISRKLKRATERLRKELLRTLRARGLSRRAAEEALGPILGMWTSICISCCKNRTANRYSR